MLVTLCSRSFRGGKTIVFFRTKQRAHRAKILFGLAGLPPAAELHGNMSQTARLESLDQFRKVCMSTDIYFVLSCAVLYNTPLHTPHTLTTHMNGVWRAKRKL